MKENTQEKMMIKVNQNSIFVKIKMFFRKLFNKENSKDNKTINFSEKNTISNVEINKSSFIADIKNIESDETKLLKLQQKYRSGEIKEEELTKEQVNALCALYDKQIENLRKSNEFRRKKLLEYRRELKNEG